MNWNEIFDAANVPSEGDIGEYLGEAKLIWNEFIAYIEETYQVKPQFAFSKCPMQPGWNIKYKKGGKALCTLYPMEGYFFALVVVGPKEEEEVRLCMDIGVFTPYIKELYEKTTNSAMGRWLMIEVKDNAVLNDIKHLLEIRLGLKRNNK